MQGPEGAASDQVKVSLSRGCAYALGFEMGERIEIGITLCPFNQFPYIFFARELASTHHLGCKFDRELRKFHLLSSHLVGKEHATPGVNRKTTDQS